MTLLLTSPRAQHGLPHCQVLANVIPSVWNAFPTLPTCRLLLILQDSGKCCLFGGAFWTCSGLTHTLCSPGSGAPSGPSDRILWICLASSHLSQTLGFQKEPQCFIHLRRCSSSALPSREWVSSARVRSRVPRSRTQTRFILMAMWGDLNHGGCLKAGNEDTRK